MEEPPKIVRIVTTQGISLSDTSTILKAYLSNIDQYHHHNDATLPLDKAVDEKVEDNATSSKEEVATTVDEDGNKKTIITPPPPRKTRQEIQEEALIAQMDQLVNSSKSSSGMISDDVYERLKMIAKSICAEVEGKPLSASGVTKSSDRGLEEEQNDDNVNDGANDFLAELEEAEQLEKEEQQKQQQQPQQVDKRGKKKEKKAKKAAKKAKKDAKRKAKEMDEGTGNDAKRAKVDS